MDGEGGQGTVEWVTVVLVIVLALGALLTLAPKVEGRGLGELLAHRVVCAVRGSCGEGSARAPVAVGVPPGERLRSQVPAVAPPAPLADPRPSGRPGSGVPVSADRAAAAFRVLRGVRAVARRAWIACLGWERYRWELAHPELAVPGQPMPLKEALRIANACLNPAQFLVQGSDP